VVGGLQGGVEGVGHDFCGWFVRFVVGCVGEGVCVAIYGCWFSGGVQVMELLRGHWSCCFKGGAEQPGRSDDDDLQTLVTCHTSIPSIPP
jgi:hypothetical protein